MNRILAFVLALTLCVFTSFAQEKISYEVLRFTNPDITINGQKVRQGLTFKSDAPIGWPQSDKAQFIECKNKKNGMLYRYSDSQFAAHKARTIAEFYLRVNKASTRETGADAVPFEESKVTGGERRIALVIGNSEYSYQPYLRNAASDAEAVQKKLLSLGFDIVYGYDCTYARMRTLLNYFSNKAKDYDAAVIYYSGHGVQNKDQNYMVPVECPLEYESNLNQCVGAYDFVEKLEETDCSTKIVFFDACRNVQTSWKRSAERGLASMEGTPGMVIVFSTQKGRTASDGEGDNSPFAEALLDNIDSNASFSDMMNNVVKQTYSVTGKEQYPVTMGNLMSGFRFNPQGGELPAVKQPAKQTQSANAQQSQAPADKPAENKPKPTMEFDAPNVEVKLTNLQRIGRNVMLRLIFTNKQANPILAFNESRDPCHENYYYSIAYDDTGKSYQYGSGLKVINSPESFYDRQTNLPVGVPVAMYIMIENVAPEVETLPLVQICFRGFNTPGMPYGEALLCIRNIPLNKS